ncbi:CBF/Mak21 family-domain-containing protein [Crucibulum laeve]|uniref:CBF/Mak21 family-domain-containing protein n=1 Tax=Crucibulum laeve TaxID=68775 RepID=A0A5C3M5D0_9AGAR|nr:CBF/Mak21 family-domain-containing protein [Crucibulum laeve]
MAPVRSLPPPSKKRKIQKDVGRVQTIKQLEDQLTRAVASNTSLNQLADLLDLGLTLEDPQDTSKAIYALYRVFVTIITNDKLGLSGDEAAKTVKAWLLERLNIYVEFLVGLLKDEEKFLRTSALQILFSLQKHLSTSYSKPSHPQFHNSHFRKIINALLTCPRSARPGSRKSSTSKDDTDIDPDVLNQFYDTWFSVYDDIRWYFLRESATLLGNGSSQTHPNIAANLLSILERLTTFPTEQAELNSWWVTEMGTKPPKLKRAKKAADGAESSDEDEEKPTGDRDEEDDDWRKFFEDEPAPVDDKKGGGVRLHQMTIHQSLHALSSHQAVFTRAWLTLLPRLSVARDGERSRTLATRALNIMHRGVLPHLTRPVLVMDWVGACVDYGGTVGLLALNALFHLMKEYNLDYPSFYTRLYAFLDRDVLHLKHRARFFRLTELFLSSTHLPATLLASFIKRLSRLSLTAPPAAIVMAIPFTYNILKRHPALMVMIHRIDVSDVLDDPFLAEETDPLVTRAIDSSLWELLSHSSHYHASVSVLCKIFSEAFTKPGYAMEDFLDHTYATLFDTEAGRKTKREPALGMELVKGVNMFPVASNDEKPKGVDPEMAAVTSGDVVSELWSFA